MTIEIKTDTLVAQISPHGAELQSLTTVSGGDEFIWQGAPDVWAGRAPILFPIIGVLRDNMLVHAGQSLPIPKHGLARQSRFDCIEQSIDTATFRFASTDDTLASYPWKFELDCKFTLGVWSLIIDYRVTNCDENEMIFTIGSHPAFALPLSDAELTDYSIEFEQNETLNRYYLDCDGLLSEQSTPFLNNENRIAIDRQLFADDAIVFKNIRSRQIHLVGPENTRRLTVNTGGAPHLGLWAKPGAAFVCIEPWFGFNSSASDSILFEEKPSMKRLAAGQEFRTSMGIEIHS